MKRRCCIAEKTWSSVQNLVYYKRYSICKLDAILDKLVGRSAHIILDLKTYNSCQSNQIDPELVAKIQCFYNCDWTD